MSNYHFGIGFGLLPKETTQKLSEIAHKLGATFTNIEVPGWGYQYWFSCEDAGVFNTSVERGVFALLKVEGIAWPPEASEEPEPPTVKVQRTSHRPTMPVVPLTSRDLVWGRK